MERRHSLLWATVPFSQHLVLVGELRGVMWPELDQSKDLMPLELLQWLAQWWPHGLSLVYWWPYLEFYLWVPGGRNPLFFLGIANLGGWSLEFPMPCLLLCGESSSISRKIERQRAKIWGEKGGGRREGERDDIIVWFPEDSSSSGLLRYEPVSSDVFWSQTGLSFSSSKLRILINLSICLK